MRPVDEREQCLRRLCVHPVLHILQTQSVYLVSIVFLFVGQEEAQTDLTGMS